MKKLLVLIAIFSLVGTRLFAQDGKAEKIKKELPPQVSTTSPNVSPFQKGNFFVGGNTDFDLGLKFIKFDERNSAYFNFNLDVLGGYFIANNFSVALRAGTSLISLPELSSDSSKVSPRSELGVSVGLMFTYYVKNFFVEAGYLFQKPSFGKDVLTSITESFSDLSQINVGVGYAFFFNQRWAFTPSVNYIHAWTHDDSRSYDYDDLRVKLGVKYFIFRK